MNQLRKLVFGFFVLQKQEVSVEGITGGLVVLLIGNIFGFTLGFIFGKRRDKTIPIYETSAELKKRRLDGTQSVIEASTDIKKCIDTVVEPMIKEIKAGNTVSSQRINKAIKELISLRDVFNEVVKSNRTYIYYLIPFESSNYYESAVVYASDSLRYQKSKYPEEIRQSAIVVLSDATQSIRKYHAYLHKETQLMQSKMHEGLPDYSLIDDMKP